MDTKMTPRLATQFLIFVHEIYTTRAVHFTADQETSMYYADHRRAIILNLT